MKKIFAIICALTLALTLCASALAEHVAVAISDDTGALVFCDPALEVSDVNGDGSLTIYDALYAAHELGFSGGAAAGLDAADSGYGLSLTKLWGVDNGGSYGYYLNDKTAMSLDDAVAEGDYLRAYAYTDLVNWSDTYACFDRASIEVAAGEAIHLTLTSVDWSANSAPIAGAEILVNGEASGVLTDAEGTAEIVLEQSGSYVISARSSALTMVAPVCFASVK